MGGVERRTGRRAALMTGGAVLAAGVLGALGNRLGAHGAGRQEVAGGAVGAPTESAAPTPSPAANTGRFDTPLRPSVAWSVAVSGSTADAAPTLVHGNGGLYVVDRLTGVTALDATTGRNRWSFPGPTTGALVAGRTAVYVCAAPVGRTMRLVALDPASGRMLWSYDAPAHTVLDTVGGELDGAVLLLAFNQRTARRELWSLDASSRRVRWQAPCPEQTEAVHVPASGGVVYGYAPGGTGITALDTGHEGRMLWSAVSGGVFGGELGGSSAIASGFVGGVIVTSPGDGTVSGLDPATGRALWRTGAATGPDGPGFLQLFAGADDYYTWDGSVFAAVRPGAAGARRWHAATSPGPAAVNANAVVDGVTLYVYTDALYAVDARTGGVHWQYAPQASALIAADTPLAAGGGRCYLAEGAKITAFSA